MAVVLLRFLVWGRIGLFRSGVDCGVYPARGWCDWRDCFLVVGGDVLFGRVGSGVFGAWLVGRFLVVVGGAVTIDCWGARFRGRCLLRVFLARAVAGNCQAGVVAGRGFWDVLLAGAFWAWGDWALFIGLSVFWWLWCGAFLIGYWCVTVWLVVSGASAFLVGIVGAGVFWCWLVIDRIVGGCLCCAGCHWARAFSLYGRGLLVGLSLIHI